MQNVTRYPDLVKLGLPPCLQVYERQPCEMLVIFGRALEDRKIDKLLRNLDLVHVDRVRNWPGGHRMATGTRRWVVHTEGGEVTPERVRALLTRAAGALKLVSPVYYKQGAGPGSAIAPMARNLMVKYVDSADRKLVTLSVRALGGRRSRKTARVLAPFVKVDLFRGDWRDTDPEEREPSRAFAAMEQANAQPVVEIAEMSWTTFEAACSTPYIPSDTFYAEQWNMTRIGMEVAWGEQLGTSSLTIAIVDPRGFDVSHGDLDFGAVANHYDSSTCEDPTPSTDVAPSGTADNYHGTNVAGLAGAQMNSQGVAGVAGGCTILPIKCDEADADSTDEADANWATTPTEMFCAAVQHSIDKGAKVLVLPLSCSDEAPKITKLNDAWNSGMVIVAAAGQGYWGDTNEGVGFPAIHPKVIAVGASDKGDPNSGLEERLHIGVSANVSNDPNFEESPDGQDWLAYSGPELDVLAPGVELWTTDLVGGPGLNSGLTKTIWGKTYPPSENCPTDLDYTALAGGSSNACPQVAGIAALLYLRYGAAGPTSGITNQQVRDIIERTCDKVNEGTGSDQYDYAHTTGRPNGSWHEKAGYGRVNAAKALCYADLMIPDHSLDDGGVPSCTMTTAGWQPLNYWSHQPFVTHTSTPGATAADHQDPIPGQTNYVHATIRNLGPADASSIHVSWHIADYPGTALLYPADFNASNQIAQGTLASLAAGTEIDVEAEWPPSAIPAAPSFAQPCMLVKVTCGQDGGGGAGPRVWEHNNVSQRNISFALVGNPVPGPIPERTVVLPFAAGHRDLGSRQLALAFDLRRAQGARVLLDLDPPDDLPFVGAIRGANSSRRLGEHLVALGDVHLGLPMVAGFADMLLKAGSRIHLPFGHGGAPDPRSKEFTGQGAREVTVDGREYLHLEGLSARIRFPVDAGQQLPLALRIEAPEGAVHGDRFVVDVTEMEDGTPVGGVTLHVQVVHDEPDP